MSSNLDPADVADNVDQSSRLVDGVQVNAITSIAKPGQPRSGGGDPVGKVLVLITLRKFAAEDPPQRSVAGHIEHTLATLHQCAISRIGLRAYCVFRCVYMLG